MGRAFFLWVLAIFVLIGQTKQAPRAQVPLTIKVVDASTGAPISGTGVILSDWGNVGYDLYPGGMDASPSHMLAPVTDNSGQSTVLVPVSTSLDIFATAHGYARPAGIKEITSGTVPFRVTIALEKGGVIRGRLVDEHSRRPLAGKEVDTRQPLFTRGLSEFSTAHYGAKTDREGRFEIDELLSGAYILETNSLNGGDHAYATQEWPGGGDFRHATPLLIRAGQAIDLGDLALEKASGPSVRYRIDGDCGSLNYTVTLTKWQVTKSDWANEKKTVPCGASGALRVPSSGRYQLTASPAQTADFPERMASQWFEVGIDDIETVLTIQEPITINGTVISRKRGAETGIVSEKTLPGIVRLFSENGRLVDYRYGGSFTLRAFSSDGEKVSVRVDGGVESPYIEAVVYNGHRFEGNQFVPDRSAPEQNLKVVCSDRFGVLSAAVKNTGGDSVDVVVVPWPSSETIYPTGVREWQSRDDGKVTIDGLRPGRYKAIAMRAEDRNSFEAPGRLIAAASKGLDVDIAVGQNSIEIQKLER